uniref:Uncharacterized protein n=1 Tax=Leptospira ellisii TaxID=2023197 RepID=A0A2N0B626_9LEPT|nr:hypothetical protein CH379_15460 [Leptospira ellisii]
MITVSFLGILFFQVGAIPSQSTSPARSYIPLEKAVFEHEIENAEFPFSEAASRKSSILNSALGDWKQEALDFDAQQSVESSAYPSENSFLASQFDFVLHRIFDTSAFLQDFLKSSISAYSYHFHSPKNEGALKILFTSLVAVSQNRKGEAETFSPNLSNAAASNFLSSFRSFVFFQASRISQPERAKTERKRSRYLALLFHFPPNFDLGSV